MELEQLQAELGVLTATDRPLTASDERKRSWLVAEIANREAHRELESGIASTRALLAAWELRVEPAPLPLET